MWDWQEKKERKKGRWKPCIRRAEHVKNSEDGQVRQESDSMRTSWENERRADIHLMWTIFLEACLQSLLLLGRPTRSLLQKKLYTSPTEKKSFAFNHKLLGKRDVSDHLSVDSEMSQEVRETGRQESNSHQYCRPESLVWHDDDGWDQKEGKTKMTALRHQLWLKVVIRVERSIFTNIEREREKERLQWQHSRNRKEVSKGSRNKSSLVIHISFRCSTCFSRAHIHLLQQ